MLIVFNGPAEKFEAFYERANYVFARGVAQDVPDGLGRRLLSVNTAFSLSETFEYQDTGEPQVFVLPNAGAGEADGALRGASAEAAPAPEVGAVDGGANVGIATPEAAPASPEPKRRGRGRARA